jgi:hypothetical protein
MENITPLNIPPDFWGSTAQDYAIAPFWSSNCCILFQILHQLTHFDKSTTDEIVGVSLWTSPSFETSGCPISLLYGKS